MLLDSLRETSWIVYQPDKNLGLRASESEITAAASTCTLGQPSPLLKISPKMDARIKSGYDG